jgi:uncharacterized protein (TIGR00369 family)
MSEVFDDDRFCFVCGEKNDFGLRLKPQGKDGRGRITWMPGKKHQGFTGVVHGGLLSTLMDEAMAYAAMSVGGFCATAEICVKFRKPVKTDCQVTIEAELVQQRGRILKLSAVLLQDGEEKASAQGTFVQVPGSRRKD